MFIPDCTMAVAVVVYSIMEKEMFYFTNVIAF